MLGLSGPKTRRIALESEVSVLSDVLHEEFMFNRAPPLGMQPAYRSCNKIESAS